MAVGNKWSILDLASALKNSVFSRADSKLLSDRSDKLLFNGFWRNGDKQNVCLWLDKATWHDAKTGEGGGCKEFAKVAFNISLPEFMERFGSIKALDVAQCFNGPAKPKKTELIKPVQQIYKELGQKDKSHKDLAASWLETERGFINPRFYIGSGFANLAESDIGLFEPKHQKFILDRLKVATQMVVPIRGTNSDEVKNLFFRSISACPKGEKSRLLASAGAWQEPDGSPRAFGFPHLIKDFPGLIICEGMADYFATEYLLADEHKFLPIGAASASALPKWAQWLAETKYKGQVVLLNQLDRTNNELSSDAVGQKSSIDAMKIFLNYNIKASFFAWHGFLSKLNNHINITKILDIADVCALSKNQNLSPVFLNAIKQAGEQFYG